MGTEPSNGRTTQNFRHKGVLGGAIIGEGAHVLTWGGRFVRMSDHQARTLASQVDIWEEDGEDPDTR